jgi:hypothetical protein
MPQSKFESLETGQMMAAGPTADDRVINGTDAADVITTTQAGNSSP